MHFKMKKKAPYENSLDAENRSFLSNDMFWVVDHNRPGLSPSNTRPQPRHTLAHAKKQLARPFFRVTALIYCRPTTHSATEKNLPLAHEAHQLNLLFNSGKPHLASGVSAMVKLQTG